MRGWRCAKCRVELGVCTDDYGQQRTETDNTDDRPAGVQNKPYLHKPRKRHYLQTTSRLSGNSRTTGGGNVPLRSVAPFRWSGLIDHHKPRKWHYPQTTSRLSGNSRTTGAKPAAKGRYRDAIREFCQGGGEGVDSRPQPSRRPTTRLARASEIAPPVTSKT